MADKSKSNSFITFQSRGIINRNSVINSVSYGEVFTMCGKVNSYLVEAAVSCSETFPICGKVNSNLVETAAIRGIVSALRDELNANCGDKFVESVNLNVPCGYSIVPLNTIN